MILWNIVPLIPQLWGLTIYRRIIAMTTSVLPFVHDPLATTSIQFISSQAAYYSIFYFVQIYYVMLVEEGWFR